MEYFEICGGRKVKGSVTLSGAKNAVLPCLAASILTDEEVILRDCPKISDVDFMIDLLCSIGIDAYREGRAIITKGEPFEPEITSFYSTKMRASIFLLAPLLSTAKKVRTAFPGGCDIGLRKINLHTENLKKMGVEIFEDSNGISCYTNRLHGANIHLDFPSVGASETLIMAAVKADGETIIDNIALEPEVRDLIDMLKAMGAKIYDVGEKKVCIEGVKKLNGITFTPLPDRIVGGTLMVLCALCGGELEIANFPDHLAKGYTKLLAGKHLEINSRYGIVTLDGLGMQEGLGEIVTAPYPGFPTDMQAQIMALASTANGRTIIKEKIFENRFLIASELKKMGAKIEIEGNTAVVDGVENLVGTNVTALDLRGGAGLVLAGAYASGITKVYGIDFIDRGYEKFEDMLSNVGVRIERKST